ncbi:MAG TPA: NifU N-terminal domain-containing protein [Acidimicrobiia bacterium]|nr:NifU N-terminal domain-containing protein [Acidimicrobiia bacterium]
MPVIVSQTPNPNALKFTVSTVFDAPRSFAAGKPTDDPVAGPLLAIPGVTSVFMSADFVTLSKDPTAHWDAIVPEATGILEITFG